jgi:hypothetical protein
VKTTARLDAASGEQQLDDFAQVVTGGLHADPADQTADIQDGRFAFVAAHAAIVLFDVLPNDLSGDIIGAAQRFIMRATPTLETRQA